MEDIASDLESVRTRVLALRNSGWRALHERSGIPFSTIKKFAYGEVRVPLYETVLAIKHALPATEAAKAEAP